MCRNTPPRCCEMSATRLVAVSRSAIGIPPRNSLAFGPPSPGSHRIGLNCMASLRLGASVELPTRHMVDALLRRVGGREVPLIGCVSRHVHAFCGGTPVGPGGAWAASVEPASSRATASSRLALLVVVLFGVDPLVERYPLRVVRGRARRESPVDAYVNRVHRVNLPQGDALGTCAVRVALARLVARIEEQVAGDARAPVYPLMLCGMSGSGTS